MPLDRCHKCNRMHYRTDPCPAEKVGHSAAPIKMELPSGKVELLTAKRGRPRIHPDRKAYKAAKEREYRARRKAQEAKP